MALVGPWSIGGGSSQPDWSLESKSVSSARYISAVAELNLADLLMCFRWDQRLRKYVETP